MNTRSASTLFALTLVTFGGGAALAQPLPLPAPSPHASVSQTVGITDIAIDYSSPGLKGRKPFGELVPFGQVWRAGANASTKVTFSTDVSVDGKPVPAGTYSLFFVPTAKEWTVVLNKVKDATALPGPQQYDQKNDLLRVTVKPEKAPKRERMIYLFANTTDDGTRIDMEWDELRVSLPVKVDTGALATAGIQGYVDNGWRPLANAARYYGDTVKDSAKALALANASIAIKETWFNDWVKAGILASANNYKDAYPLVQKAYDLGQKDANFFAKADVEKALAEWKLKL